MQRVKIFGLLATILIAAMVVGACGGSQGATGSTSSTGLGTVKVGTNAEYPPFESVDANGKIIGFDIDLMNAIGKAAGFTPEFTNTKWDGIFVALASGEFDAVSSAVTITEERKQAMAFSDPYFNAGQMIAVKKGSPVTKPEDLAGKKVGVQLGTTGDVWISDQAEKGTIAAEVARYDEITLAFQALANGDIDAIVNDAPTSADIIKANPEWGVSLVGQPFTDEFYGFAIRKERADVIKAINEGLAKVKASGEYDKIYTQWFGAPPPK
jgi:lysine-arginine-ornithine-binding protein